MTTRKILAFPHPPPAVGGPGSFQMRFEREMRHRGWTVAYAGEKRDPTVIVVVGGTRKLYWLWKCKRRGVRVVHRLDGMNWHHRVRWTGVRAWIRAEIANALMKITRRHIADVVIYQSKFVLHWWRERFDSLPTPYRVIYNGVDLNEFYPRPLDVGTGVGERVVCLEGNITGELALHTWQGITKWPIMVYGHVLDDINQKLAFGYCRNVILKGSVAREDVPFVFTGRSIYLSLDINAACPNAVIEALASGLPVVGYDTGSLKELVGEDAGILVPYCGNQWTLELPGGNNIEKAIALIFSRYDEFSRAARDRAEMMFGIERMIEEYVDVLESGKISSLT